MPNIPQELMIQMRKLELREVMILSTCFTVTASWKSKAVALFFAFRLFLKASGFVFFNIVTLHICHANFQLWLTAILPYPLLFFVSGN